MAQSNPHAPRNSATGQVVFWVALALAVGAIIWVRHGRSRGESAVEGRRHPAVGRELPDLELKALTGASTNVNLQSLRGNVVLINFWGTWCPPCQRELPHIAQLRHELAAQKDFRLLAVSCPGDEDSLDELRRATQSFLASENIDLPTYADPDLTTRRAVGMALGQPSMDIAAFPTTVLIDRQGVIQAVWERYVPGLEKQMLIAIKEVLQ